MENQLPAIIKDPLFKAPQSLHKYDYGYFEDELKQNRLYDYWHILMKRKWLVIWVFLGFLLTVGIVLFFKTPIYRATVLLQIIQDNTSAMIGGDRDPFTNFTSDGQSKFYETQYMLLTSRPLAQKIMDNLNLRKYPEFQQILKICEENKTSPEETNSALLNKFLADLTINPLKKSYLVELSYDNPDRHLAQNIVNAIYKEYVNLCMNTRQQSYVLIKDWLQNQLTKLGEKVENSERKLYNYGKNKQFLSLEKEDNVIVKKYVELSSLLTTAHAERSRKEAQYRQVKEKGLSTTQITDNPLIQRLREETITQEAKVSSLSQIYDINYPGLKVEQAKLRELRSRLNGEVNRIRESITADYQAAVKTENLLREELEAQKGKVSELQNNLVQHNILKRDVQTNQQLYEALLSRMKEASIASTMVASNVAVIAPAELPLIPHRPKKLLNLLLAGSIGLMSGIALAFWMEYMDKSVKTSEELEKICRIPSLGMIPHLKSVDNKNKRLSLNSPNKIESQFITFKQPKSPISDAIFHIRASIELSGPKGAPKVLLVTSPNASDGKTTISINLASALAASGRKVVFLDADLRKPSSHVFFQQSLSPGLTNLITGSATKIIRSTFIPNLDFVPGGDICPNPVALLSSLAFEEFINDLRNEYQHIIIDSPPVIGFADGRIISALSDGVVIILKHHFTTREAARLAVKLMEKVNGRILGGVLNMAKKKNVGYCAFGEYYKEVEKYYPQE